MKKIFILSLISLLSFGCQTLAESPQKKEIVESNLKFQDTLFAVPSYNFNKLIYKISKNNNIPVIFNSKTNKNFNIAIFNEKLSNTDAIYKFDFNPVIQNYLSGIKYLSGMNHISTEMNNFEGDNVEIYFDSVNPYNFFQSIFGYKDKEYIFHIKINNQTGKMANITFTFSENGNPKKYISGTVDINIEHNEFIIQLDNNIIIFASIAFKTPITH